MLLPVIDYVCRVVRLPATCEVITDYRLDRLLVAAALGRKYINTKPSMEATNRN